jgi:hypothetical protein
MSDPMATTLLSMAETDIPFGQISLIAWPFKAAAEDASGYAGVRRCAPETEAKRINEPSTTPTEIRR